MTNEQAISSFVMENRNLSEAPNNFAKDLERNYLAMSAIKKMEQIMDIVESYSITKENMNDDSLSDFEREILEVIFEENEDGRE
jgi:hypothetical protein